MSDCIFCQIATGKIQGLRVFEDEKTLAIMDIAKDVDGHMLVIPKKHCKNILDCDRETLNAVMDTVRKVSRHLTEKCGYDGVNLLFPASRMIRLTHGLCLKVRKKISLMYTIESAWHNL